ncbi:hypothetical protein [Mumia sp. DW29H23]|uniref:hypothetical protein n=1 Tax=Mumia sp. DW29H23 TaxID=3421241 RepID=UPI003D69A920
MDDMGEVPLSPATLPPAGRGSVLVVSAWVEDATAFRARLTFTQGNDSVVIVTRSRSSAIQAVENWLERVR